MRLLIEKNQVSGSDEISVGHTVPEVDKGTNDESKSAIWPRYTSGALNNHHNDYIQTFNNISSFQFIPWLSSFTNFSNTP